MEVIVTPHAPTPIGPYCHAVRTGDLLFASGQIPLTLSGEVVAVGIAAQTECVFDHIEAILAAAGATLADIVKATVFLKNFDDFPAMNAVYAQRLGDHKPARSTVEVARLPKDVLVEIEVIAALSPAPRSIAPRATHESQPL